MAYVAVLCCITFLERALICIRPVQVSVYLDQDTESRYKIQYLDTRYFFVSILNRSDYVFDTSIRNT